jgi:hypothetical protein
LRRFLEGAGFNYRDGIAAHLDLVQESTSPVWSQLSDDSRTELLLSDLPFLKWQLESRPIRAVFCNGRTVGDTVRSQLGVRVETEGEIMRLRWWTGRANIAGRDVSFASWNYPLDRPTGLRAEAEREFGVTMASRLGLRE